MALNSEIQLYLPPCSGIRYVLPRTDFSLSVWMPKLLLLVLEWCSQHTPPRVSVCIGGHSLLKGLLTPSSPYSFPPGF